MCLGAAVGSKVIVGLPLKRQEREDRAKQITGNFKSVLKNMEDIAGLSQRALISHC